MIRVRLPNTLTWVMCQNLPTNMITSTRNTNVEMACPDVCQNLMILIGSEQQLGDLFAEAPILANASPNSPTTDSVGHHSDRARALLE